MKYIYIYILYYINIPPPTPLPYINVMPCPHIRRIPENLFSFALGNGRIMDFTFHSSFWIFNLVANWAYTRYNIIYPEIRAKIDEIEDKFIYQISEIVAEVMNKYKQNVEL